MEKKIVTIDPKLQALFDQMPGCWGCKDEHSIYMYANKEFTKIVGLGENNPLNIIGKTDDDLPCETAKCGDLFRKQDRKVMTSGKRVRILDIHPFAVGGWMAYIFTKTPLYDDNKKVIGTIFHGVNITHSKTLELGSLLSKISVNVPQASFYQNSFLLGHSLYEVKLSDREAECLFFILRGKTVKLIASYYGISPRTVEWYVDNLKKKFNAQNKYELIDKAIHAGFLNSIPEGLFHTQLSVILGEE